MIIICNTLIQCAGKIQFFYVTARGKTENATLRTKVKKENVKSDPLYNYPWHYPIHGYDC